MNAEPTRRTPTAKLRAYLLLAAGGMIGGLAGGRPQLAALAAPFAAYVALGIALERRPRLTIRAEDRPERTLEGEDIACDLRLQASSAIHRLELELRPGAGVTPRVPERQVLALGEGEERELRIIARAARWGVRHLGTISCRVYDRFGLIQYELDPVSLGVVSVFPRGETLRELIN
ncbi:MAG TPA: hypothetical protein VIX82_02655, partial [Solirubrobacteraceae bacterium]